jgi:hypothetical protein
LGSGNICEPCPYTCKKCAYAQLTGGSYEILTCQP